MAVGLASPKQFDRQKLAELHASLSEVFDGPFQFWYRDDHWRRLTTDQVADDVFSEHGDDAKLDALLTATTHTKAAATAESDDGTWLAVPLPLKGRQPVVAARRFDSGGVRSLEKLADMFVREMESQAELASLRHEHQAFLRQVTNDFEELTFLRSMAELLEISELSFDFTAMAETVLPTLMPLLEADCLILVVAEQQAAGDEDLPPSVGLPTVWAGTRAIAAKDCQRLIESYRAECESQPVVKNNFESTAEAENFPGVNSFIIVPIVNGAKSLGWLLALNRNNERNMNTEQLPWEVSYLEFGTHEATLMSSSASILATHARNVELFREREQLLVSVVRALVSAVEAKDEYTRGHSERVALYGKRLAEEMGLGEAYCERLYLTGLLHDIGKIGVRDAVLRKPGPLTDDEFEEIKQHPDKGWAILHDLEPLSYVLPGVLHHHENINGRGYPDGLAGDQIPLDGRIMAIVDAFDAMTSDRPYRDGMPLERAEAILKEGAGEQWDAAMIDAFFRALPDILDIKRKYQPRAHPVRRAKQTV